MNVTLQSTLTCPACGTRSVQRMAEDSCRYLHVCANCGTTLKPKAGDCCVFCSYGDVACPPRQRARAGRMDARA